MGRIEHTNKADHSALIGQLIEKGQTINSRIEAHSLYPVISPVKSFEEYKNWTEEVRSFFESHNLNIYLPKDFFVGTGLKMPYPQPKLNDKAGYIELKKLRLELSGIIDRHISYLKEVAEKLNRKSKVLTIYLDGTGLVWREPKERFFHQGNKNDKRFKLLKVLAQGKGGLISTRQLKEKIKYSSLQVLSQEKKDINSLMEGALELPGDLILSLRTKGYRINPLFDISISNNLD